MRIKFFIIILAITFCITAAEAATKKSLFGGVYTLFDFLQKDNPNNTNNTTKTVEEMTVDELGVSRGQCYYQFLQYISYEDTLICSIDDEYILHLLPTTTATETPRKPPIMVKCLPDHPLIVNGSNELRVMNSVQDIVDLLKPIGNNTKRYQPGSCVLVFFYTATCLTSSLIAIPITVAPHMFKTIPVAAIDAYRFPGFNTEFGIIALPTVMLFHQGRPVVKYHGQGNFNTFVTRHTGLKQSDVPNHVELAPLNFKIGYYTDYVLILAWMFILSCAGYYFSKSQLFKQIVEMIKRNWRESEAQLDQ